MNQTIYDILTGMAITGIIVLSCTATYYKNKIIYDYFNKQIKETEINGTV